MCEKWFEICRAANEIFIAVHTNETAAATRQNFCKNTLTNKSYRAANKTFIAVHTNEVDAATRRRRQY